MSFELETPTVEGVRIAAEVLGAWQDDAAPMQLHPGDLGWFCRFGPGDTAASVRTWTWQGRLLAIGLLDEPTSLRIAIAPAALREPALADRLFADLTEPDRGVLPAGRVSLEAPRGALVRDLLGEAGWQRDEPWTSLRRVLSRSVEEPDLRVEGVRAETVSDRTAVQRAAFQGSTFTDERWQAMAAAPTYADARCLVAYDVRGDAVAAVTVWSAGPGRPGLLEPMGVHRDHRGRGYGRAISLAAAGALRAMGSSSATVCTPSSNVGAVATYRGAGFETVAEVSGLHRPRWSEAPGQGPISRERRVTSHIPAR